MTAYYNEIEPYAAQWLRNLIAAGHIAPGDVDTRSIEDVTPNELRGYAQCHFFAGIGVWSYALRLAGWPDDRPVWTGSCPCQPFSSAGKGEGFADERHLWPAFYHLIRECRPAVVLGEQVASSNAAPWLDLVQDDLEILDYAFGAVPFPAAGVGAPHIRDRTYWVADNASERRGEAWSSSGRSAQRVSYSGQFGRLGDDDAGLQGYGESGEFSLAQGREGAQRHGAEASLVGGLADATQRGRGEERAHGGGLPGGDGAQRNATGFSPSRDDHGPSPTNGVWRDVDWLHCRDGKWRPVEPGTFPLAHGAAARVGRLRAYGNAIVAPQAAQFVAAVMDCLP